MLPPLPVLQTSSKIILLVIALFCGSIAQAQVTIEAIPLDTAYVDPMEHYDNQADSVVVQGHTFKGPGPFTVHFRAEMDRKPDYCAWELATDNKFTDLIDRFRTLEHDDVTSVLDYEFSEQGSVFVRFTADFFDGTDTLTYYTSAPYEVTISTSLLEIPNLITPESASGSNRVFKVKYQSLVEYEMWVFNRWGIELFHSTDPSEGWDGTYNGSTVPTGAYYYVVKAVGTDGEKYHKKGAVNVLKTRDRSKT